MSDTLIKVEGLYKKFTTSLKRSMWYGSIDTIRTMASINYDTTKLRKGEFWALQDINFELKRGECLGLIGRNGSGKSTLLRLLSGVFPPDKGKITMRGRIGALIALGVGFHPHMSGKENVFLNGAILGFSKNDIQQKFDEIVDFAEIGDFIDAPVSTYSSGMKVRLGYAIAAQMEPDILLIDEVLAVGDIGFRAKCLNSIAKISKDAAVIFVSHAMPQIARVSTQVMLLDSGTTTYYGDVAKGVENYYKMFPEENMVEVKTHFGQISAYKIFCNGTQLVKPQYDIPYGSKFEIEFEITAQPEMDKINIYCVFYDKDLKPVAQTTTFSSIGYVQNNNQINIIRMSIDKILLALGCYSITLLISKYIGGINQGEMIHRIQAAFSINITDIFPTFAPVLFESRFIQIQ